MIRNLRRFLPRFSAKVGLCTGYLVLCTIDAFAETRISVLGQDVRPGTSVTVPIVVESEDILYGAQFDVLHDPENLIASLVVAPTSVPANVVVKSNILSPGRQRVVIYSQSVEPLENGSLAEFSFRVPPDIAIESTTIRLESLALGNPSLEASGLVKEDGVLSVLFIPQDVNVSGRVSYYASDRNMADVRVLVRGEGGEGSQTDTSGRYQLSLPSETPFQLELEQDNDSNANLGVTSLDLLLLRRQILGLDRFDEPAQLLAGDVDRGGDIGVIDLLLMRRLILGLEMNYVPGQSLFRFYPSSADFSALDNPWMVDEVIAYPSLSADLSEQDFVGVKLGDVDGDWLVAKTAEIAQGQALQPASTFPLNGTENEVLEIFVEEIVPTHNKNGVWTFAVSARGAKGISSLQFSLGWNSTEAELLEVNIAQLPGLESSNFGFGKSLLNPGLLTFAWSDISEAGVDLDGDTVLFFVNFKALSASAFIPWLDSSPTPVFASKGYVPLDVRFLGTGGNLLETSEIHLRYRLDSSKTGTILVEIDSEKDVTYVLEYCDSLVNGGWVPLSSKPGNGGMIQFGDLGATAAHRFYQVRQFSRNLAESEERW